jgi:hypothetical protein
MSKRAFKAFSIWMPIIILVWLLLYTPVGIRLALLFVAYQVPGTIHIENIRGGFKQAVFENVTYDDGNMHVFIKQAKATLKLNKTDKSVSYTHLTLPTTPYV